MGLDLPAVPKCLFWISHLCILLSSRVCFSWENRLKRVSDALSSFHVMQLVSFALQGANQELKEGRREGLNEHLLDAMGLQAKKTITNLSGREFVWFLYGALEVHSVLVGVCSRPVGSRSLVRPSCWIRLLKTMLTICTYQNICANLLFILIKTYARFLFMCN